MHERVNLADRLGILLQRQSCGALEAPAPEGEALQLIIQAALRVPDHQRLHPYAFIIASGDGLQRLGAIMQRAAIAAGKPADVVRRSIRMPSRAPMVIVVVVTPRPHDVVPVFDQQLAAGCAVMAMQMASQALGFGGIWRSGWFMYDRLMHRELDLRDEDQIVGFLYLGTPKAVVPSPPAIDSDSFIRWL